MVSTLTGGEWVVGREERAIMAKLDPVGLLRWTNFIFGRPVTACFFAVSILTVSIRVEQSAPYSNCHLLLSDEP